MVYALKHQHINSTFLNLNIIIPDKPLQNVPPTPFTHIMKRKLNISKYKPKEKGRKERKMKRKRGRKRANRKEKEK